MTARQSTPYDPSEVVLLAGSPPPSADTLDCRHLPAARTADVHSTPRSPPPGPTGPTLARSGTRNKKPAHQPAARAGAGVRGERRRRRRRARRARRREQRPRRREQRPCGGEPRGARAGAVRPEAAEGKRVVAERAPPRVDLVRVWHEPPAEEPVRTSETSYAVSRQNKRIVRAGFGADLVHCNPATEPAHNRALQ